MADAAPSAAEDPRRRGRRRGRVPDHVGDRCTMCGRMVAVDPHGRCTLGHQVISTEQARERWGDDGDRGRPATAPVPTSRPSAGGRAPQPVPVDLASGELPPTAPAAFSIASPGLRSGATDTDDPSQRDDLRDPSAELVATYAEPTPRAGRRADAPQPPRASGGPPPTLPTADPPRSLLTDDRPADASAHGRAVVPVSDLTPSAPSSLDVDDATWAPGDAPVERRYAQVPVDDGSGEPPRGLLRMIAGGLFVTVLLAVAWYLATSL